MNGLEQVMFGANQAISPAKHITTGAKNRANFPPAMHPVQKISAAGWKRDRYLHRQPFTSAQRMPSGMGTP
jgi:hypothetical protein